MRAESGDISTQMGHRGERGKKKKKKPRFLFYRAQLEAELTDLIQSSQAFYRLAQKELFVMSRLIGLRIQDTGL